MKEKLIISRKINRLSLIIIFFLIVSNIILINTHSMNDIDEIEETVYFKQSNDAYDSTKKYYASIKYKKFKKLYKANTISTIAVIDSNSNISEEFIKMINKLAYYKSTKIYVIRLNKLSTKDLASFYNLEESFSTLETNYIITVSNGKILSTATFDKENINLIEKELGE